MDEIGKNNGDWDDGMGKPGFFDERALVDDGGSGLGKGERKKIPNQESVEEEKIIIFDRLRQEEGEDKSDDEHLEERVGNEPEKPKDRVLVPCPELLLRHGKEKIKK